MHCETNKNAEIMKKVILTIMLAVLTASVNGQSVNLESKYSNVTNGALILGVTKTLIPQDDYINLCKLRIKEARVRAAASEIVMRDTKDPIKYAKAKENIEFENKTIEFLSKHTTVEAYLEYKRLWISCNNKSKN